MKIETIGDSRLRVWLSEEELEKWGIQYDTMEAGREETERLLRQVLIAVQRHTGWTTRRLTIEALPVEGGCMLLVSKPSEPRQSAGPLIYRLYDLDSLFLLAERWAAVSREQDERPCSTLYELENAYIVLLYPVRGLTGQQRALLSEHGQAMDGGRIAAAAIAEHGRLLAAGNVLEQLSVTASVPVSQEPPDPPH